MTQLKKSSRRDLAVTFLAAFLVTTGLLCYVWYDTRGNWVAVGCWAAWYVLLFGWAAWRFAQTSPPDQTAD